MISENEWNIIARKAFPAKPVKAPPFLWTRVSAAIEAEERRRATTWWAQWRWMSRLTMTMGLLVSLGTFYLIQHSVLPLDVALDGMSSQQQAIQIASSDMPTPDESVAILIGLDS